jgi:mono/diheme cytochrome c family protein
MKRVRPMFLVALFVTSLQAQSPLPQSPGEYGPGGPPPPASNFNYVVPLPSSRSLSATQLAGKKLFVRECAVCHLPGNPAYPAIAPLLDKKRIASLGDAATREFILRGSVRMPGFQYVFEPAEVDLIIEYLKLLAYDPSAKKHNYASTKK